MGKIKLEDTISNLDLNIRWIEDNPAHKFAGWCNVTMAMRYAMKVLQEKQWNFLREDSDGIIHGLPGDDGQYLMTDGKDIWIDDYVDGVDDGVWLDSGRDVREIKAWMEMPELPEEST